MTHSQDSSLHEAKMPLASATAHAPSGASAPTDDLRSTVARARAQLYLQQRFTLWAGNLGLQLTCVIVIAPFHPPAVLAAWVLANASLLLLRARATAKLRREEVADAAAIEAWFRVLARYLLVAGVIWGVGAFFLLPPLHDPRALVFLLTLMGVCWGAAVALSTVFPAVVAFVVPLTSLTATRLTLTGTDIGLLLVVLTVAFTGFVLATARNYARAVDVALRLGGENLALLAQVTSARDAAERASAEKSRFLAAVSHDLRQPVHAARLAVEATLAAHEPAPSQHALMQAMSALRDLEAQFDDLLELSELEAGALEPRPCDVALSPLLAELAREFDAPARLRGLTLDIAQTTACARTDPRFIRRILRNLLDNALKYSDRGGVTVTVDELAEDVVITVADSGRGIDAALLARIFEPYVRLPGTRAESGHGLGLAIVRQLCGLLQAPLDVNSVPGSGSRFMLTLPRSAPGTDDEDSVAVDQLDSLHVLLIEDDAAARAALAALLAAWGCRVSAGADLDVVLEAASQVARPVDAIISDYRLADGADGIAVIARARASLDPDLPAVLISGERSAALAAAADTLKLPLLLKPVGAAALRATLTAVTQG